MRRRRILATAAGAAIGSTAGCSLLPSDHARLVGLAAANGRSDPATLSVRIRNAETGARLRNYRVTVDAADGRDAIREFDCEWPFREPLVIETDLLVDDDVVADSREYDTRDVDAECTNVIVRAQTNDTLVYDHGTTACSDFDHRVEECERTETS